MFRESSKGGELPSKEIYFKMDKWRHGDRSSNERRKQRLEDNCPRCKEPHEHLLHVLMCKDSDTGAFRRGLMEELWLQKGKTEPNLERFLTLGLQSWIIITQIITDVTSYLDPASFECLNPRLCPVSCI